MSTKKPLVLPIGRHIQALAPRIGASVLLEPTWKMVGQITYPNGRRRYFRLSSLDLNPMGASAVAKDKDYANFFMKKMGYPTIQGRTFFSDEFARKIASPRTIDAAYQYAQKIGLPVVVKPNSGTRGNGVALVHTKRDFYRAVKAIFRVDDVVLVQRFLRGRDYRIVVLDRNVISAYERIPLNVVGDGHSTIDELLLSKQKKYGRDQRDTVIKPDDPRIREKLRRERLTRGSVPARGQKVFLLDNANLSSGGDSIDVTNLMHPAFRKLAVGLTRDMGLRLCGVDLLVKGDIRDNPKHFWILEINSAPGLDHYARTGEAQMAVVERLYLRVLRSMK